MCTIVIQRNYIIKNVNKLFTFNNNNQCICRQPTEHLCQCHATVMTDFVFLPSMHSTRLVWSPKTLRRLSANQGRGGGGPTPVFGCIDAEFAFKVTCLIFFHTSAAVLAATPPCRHSWGDVLPCHSLLLLCHPRRNLLCNKWLLLV